MSVMSIGEGFVGEGADAAHVNTVLGPREGPAGVAWATALATPREGHVPFVAVVRPGLAVLPITLFVNKAPIGAGRHGDLTWGAAQAGVAAGVADAVAEGVIERAAVHELVLIAAVWVNPAARRRRGRLRQQPAGHPHRAAQRRSRAARPRRGAGRPRGAPQPVLPRVMSGSEPAPRPLAFIGLGNMGGHMSRRLARAGFDLTVFDVDARQGRGRRGRRRPRRRARPRRPRHGAARAPHQPADAGGVDDVMLGAGGVLDALPDGSLWVDLSTSMPAVAERVRTAAPPAASGMLDAPVSGMSKGAAAGTLHLYVGGAAADLDQVRPILEVIGDPGAHPPRRRPRRRLHRETPAQPALVLVAPRRRRGRSPWASAPASTWPCSTTPSSTSPASSVLLEHDLLPLLRDGDYEPGFAVALACKDLGLAVDLARAAGRACRAQRRGRAGVPPGARRLRRRCRRDVAGAALRGARRPRAQTARPAQPSEGAAAGRAPQAARAAARGSRRR